MKTYFTRTPEQVDLLVLDGSQRWFGVMAQSDEEGDERHTFVTTSQAAREALVNAIEANGLEPPAEFIERLNTAFLIVPVWPRDR